MQGAVCFQRTSMASPCGWVVVVVFTQAHVVSSCVDHRFVWVCYLCRKLAHPARCVLCGLVGKVHNDRKAVTHVCVVIDRGLWS